MDIYFFIFNSSEPRFCRRCRAQCLRSETIDLLTVTPLSSQTRSVQDNWILISLKEMHFDIWFWPSPRTSRQKRLSLSVVMILVCTLSFAFLYLKTQFKWPAKCVFQASSTLSIETCYPMSVFITVECFSVLGFNQSGHGACVFFLWGGLISH